jgi:hypothetical protein
VPGLGSGHALPELARAECSDGPNDLSSRCVAIEVALVLLVVVLVAVLVFLSRVVLSIQTTLAANPTAPLSTGILSVQSEQARVAHELGRAANALGALQGVQQNFDAALRTLAGQAVVGDHEQEDEQAPKARVAVWKEGILGVASTSTATD